MPVHKYSPERPNFARRLYLQEQDPEAREPTPALLDVINRAAALVGLHVQRVEKGEQSILPIKIGDRKLDIVRKTPNSLVVVVHELQTILRRELLGGEKLEPIHVQIPHSTSQVLALLNVDIEEELKAIINENDCEDWALEKITEPSVEFILIPPHLH